MDSLNDKELKIGTKKQIARIEPDAQVQYLFLLKPD